MILLIDVGNTRLKWAWLQGNELSDQQALVHRDLESNQWTAPLFGAPHRARRVLICNVAGPAMAQVLTTLTRQKFGLDPEFLMAQREFGPIRNGYRDPQLLGADRWLAVVGAWTRTRAAVCVIDVGTAVKVDAVDAAGRHQGGLIVPGVHLLRDALLQGTAGIAAAALLSTASSDGTLANNTIEAVSRGARIALAGFADRAVDLIAKDSGMEPALLITGGDAALVSGAMRRHAENVPDLVLQGIAAIARQGIS